MEAKTLKRLIDEKGIKQSFIAKKLGVSRALITQWINEGRPIAERHLPELKRILL